MRIVVNLRVEGFHNWPSAPEVHAYLASTHRHQFHIRAEKTVSHDDRAIEIIEFKRRIESYLKSTYTTPCAFGSCSCEMLARELVQMFDLDRCEVLEDGENGALYEPEDA